MLNPVLFPAHISAGMEGGPRFKTSVVGKTAGGEQRNIEWEYARGEWTLDRRNLHLADLVEIDKFFLAHYGMGYSFLFTDWGDYKARMIDSEDNPVLLIAEGTTPEITQLKKTYAVGLLEYVRPIHRPVEGTIVLYGDGVAIDESNYEIDYATGLITWNEAYLPAAGVEISWGGEFYVPVRFASDYQPRRYERGPRYQWNQVQIIEVRNEPNIFE